MQNIMDVLYVTRRGSMMETSEKLYIYIYIYKMKQKMVTKQL